MATYFMQPSYLRKRIDHSHIRQLVNSGYRYCDIIRKTGINKSYFYKLLRKWKADGLIKEYDPSEHMGEHRSRYTSGIYR